MGLDAVIKIAVLIYEVHASNMSSTVQKEVSVPSHTADVPGRCETNLSYYPNITLNSTDHGFRVLQHQTKYSKQTRMRLENKCDLPFM